MEKDCFKCIWMEHYWKVSNPKEDVAEDHIYICTSTQPDEEDGLTLLREINGFDPSHCLDFKLKDF